VLNKWKYDAEDNWMKFYNHQYTQCTLLTARTDGSELLAVCV